MYFKYTLIFSVTFFTSLLASIPFGPINLNVIYTTVQKNKKAGLSFAAAAAGFRSLSRAQHVPS